MSHTKGPWDVVYEWVDDGDGSETKVFNVRGFDVDDFIIEQPVTEADARLIAAAPELFESLVIAVGAIRELCHEREIPLPASTINRALASIAKAKGL